jgi:hypothetical protein
MIELSSFFCGLQKNLYLRAVELRAVTETFSGEINKSGEEANSADKLQSSK